MAEQRLQKLLAERGVASRRTAEEMIAAGRVVVNGKIAAVGLKVDAERDSIAIDGQALPGEQRLRYIMLHKPVDYICSALDERGKKSVLNLIEGVDERLYPVGRLDYDTSGLLLLTNDGAFTQALLHPSYQVNKTYAALVAGPVSATDLEKLRKGLVLEDGPTAPAQVLLKRRGQNSSLLEITIHEGRKRQVRRMCTAVGHPALRLQRLRFGSLGLGGLKPGAWRELTAREVRELKQGGKENDKAAGRANSRTNSKTSTKTNTKTYTKQRRKEQGDRPGAGVYRKW